MDDEAGTAQDSLVVEIEDDQSPEVLFVSPSSGDLVIQGDPVELSGLARDDLEVTSIEFFLDSERLGTERDSFTLELFQETPCEPGQGRPPLALGTHILGARATDSLQQTSGLAEVSFEVVADPGTTLEGRVLEADATAVAGALVRVDMPTSPVVATDGNGRFVLPGVPSTCRPLVVLAQTDSVRTAASVGLDTVVRGGTTMVPPLMFPPALLGYVVATQESRLYVVNLRSLQVVDTIELGFVASAVRVSADGGRIFAAGGGQIAAIRASDHSLEETLTLGSSATSLNLLEVRSPRDLVGTGEDASLFLSNPAERAIEVVDVRDGALLSDRSLGEMSPFPVSVTLSTARRLFFVNLRQALDIPVPELGTVRTGDDTFENLVPLLQRPGDVLFSRVAFAKNIALLPDQRRAYVPLQVFRASSTEPEASRFGGVLERLDASPASPTFLHVELPIPTGNLLPPPIPFPLPFPLDVTPLGDFLPESVVVAQTAAGPRVYLAGSDSVGAEVWAIRPPGAPGPEGVIVEEEVLERRILLGPPEPVALFRRQAPDGERVRVEPAMTLSLAPNQRLLVVSTFRTGELRLIDTTTNRIVGTMVLPGNPLVDENGQGGIGPTGVAFRLLGASGM